MHVTLPPPPTLEKGGYTVSPGEKLAKEESTSSSHIASIPI